MQTPTILADGTAVLPTPDPGVVTVKGFSRYVLGVDLAASVDNTALVLIRDEQLPDYITTIRQGLGPRRRTVVWADKFKGVSYPDIVQHVTDLLMRPQLVGKTRLVIDATGLGQVVSQLFTEQQVPHIAATMTAGYEHTLNGTRLSVPKNLLVETLAVGFSSGDLTFAHGLPLRQAIEEELQTFTLTTTAAGNQIITQARVNGSHGDLAIALALAFFVSARCQPQRMTTGRLANWY